MKKVLFALITLLLIPCMVNAASIQTEFDDERCVLTVSGSQTGHEATVSLFNKSSELIGFKTGAISSSNYSVEFVLGFESDTLIDITVANENGEGEVSKNDVNIPACEPPVIDHHDEHGDDDIFHMNKIMDPENNALEDLNGKKPFHIDDKLIIQVVPRENFEALPEEDQDNIAALKEMLGEYKEVVALMFVSVLDDVDVEKHFPDSNYKLLLKTDKDSYDEFNKLRAIRLLDEDTMDFSAPVSILYDNNAQGMYFTTENLGVFVIYDDNSKEYDFLDKTDEQTFYKKSDKTLTLKVDAPREKFVDVVVDGKKVDEKYYTVKSGSTVITFTEEFLKGLEAGEHEFVVNFTDGEAIANIKVENTSNPNTGDKVMLYVGMSILAVAGLGAVLLVNKKLKRN